MSSSAPIEQNAFSDTYVSEKAFFMPKRPLRRSCRSVTLSEHGAARPDLRGRCYSAALPNDTAAAEPAPGKTAAPPHVPLALMSFPAKHFTALDGTAARVRQLFTPPFCSLFSVKKHPLLFFRVVLPWPQRTAAFLSKPALKYIGHSSRL